MGRYVMGHAPRYCERCGVECSGTLVHDCETAAIEGNLLGDLLQRVQDAQPEFTLEELELLAHHENDSIAKKARESLEKQRKLAPEVAAFAQEFNP